MHWSIAAALLLPGVFGLPTVESPTLQMREEIFTASDGKNYTVSFGSGPVDVESRDLAKRGSQWTPTTWWVDLCGSSSFVDETSNASPNVGSCKCLVDYSWGHYGRWSMDSAERGQWQYMLRCGNCQFRALTNNAFPAGIGHSDIGDVVNDSINKFARNDRVGARGEMGCAGNFDTAKVVWAIYNSG